MAKQYAEEEACWKSLEESKIIVSSELWEVFDRLFTNKVTETNDIFTDCGYQISRAEGVIIIGLIQSAGEFIKTIKSADKNEIDETGRITLNKNICHLVTHCLRNDLNIIMAITELKIYYNEDIEKKKEDIGCAYKGIFDVILKLKTLTKDKPMGKPTILIVDDEKSFTDKLAEFLNIPFDCNVIVQNHSNDVMDTVKNQHVDILFQDIHVPGPDGFEVVKQIKKSGIDIIIFIITSWKEDAYYLKSSDLGVNYLPKPIGFKLLQNTLTEIFEKHGFDYKKKGEPWQR
jgi:CheY-like chemotaxis protein